MGEGRRERCWKVPELVLDRPAVERRDFLERRVGVPLQHREVVRPQVRPFEPPGSGVPAFRQPVPRPGGVPFRDPDLREIAVHVEQIGRELEGPLAGRPSLLVLPQEPPRRADVPVGPGVARRQLDSPLVPRQCRPHVPLPPQNVSHQRHEVGVARAARDGTFGLGKGLLVVEVGAVPVVAARPVSLREPGRQLQRPARLFVGRDHDRVRTVVVEPVETRPDHGLEGPGLGELRVELEGPRDETVGGTNVDLRAAPYPVALPGLLVGLVRLETPGRQAPQLLALPGREVRLQRRRDRGRDVRLHVEDVRGRELTAVLLGPQVGVRVRVDQLHVDPVPVPRPLHAPLEHRRDAELGGDLAHVLRRVPVLLDGGPRDHGEGADFRQLREEVVVQPVRERLRLSVPAQVGEREDRDRCFRRRRPLRLLGPGVGPRTGRRAHEGEPGCCRQRPDPDEREQSGRPAAGRGLCHDLLDLLARRGLGADHSLRRPVVGPGEHERERKAEQRQHGDPGEEGLRQAQRLLQDVGRLDDDERRAAVHRRHSEHVTTFQLGEEPLVAGGLGHAPEDRRGGGARARRA